MAYKVRGDRVGLQRIQTQTSKMWIHRKSRHRGTWGFSGARQLLQSSKSGCWGQATGLDDGDHESGHCDTVISMCSARECERADLYAVHSYLGSQESMFWETLMIQTCKFALILQYPATVAILEMTDMKASDDLSHIKNCPWSLCYNSSILG